jgi:hypothetical protein
MYQRRRRSESIGQSRSSQPPHYHHLLCFLCMFGNLFAYRDSTRVFLLAPGDCLVHLPSMMINGDPVHVVFGYGSLIFHVPKRKLIRPAIMLTLIQASTACHQRKYAVHSFTHRHLSFLSTACQLRVSSRATTFVVLRRNHTTTVVLPHCIPECIRPSLPPSS